MHIFSKEPVLWWSRNVGGQISVGAGLAFADKYFETNAVTLTYFGDGAARQGSCTKPLTYGNVMEITSFLSLKTTVTRWELCRKNC
jgi:TPP-dependent pyruvate/acetoin dehydrogenase alpha subunit